MGASSSVRKKSASPPPKDDIFSDLKDTQFSYEAAIGKVKWVCEQLGKFESARIAAVTPAISFLSLYTSASSYGPELAELWAYKLVEHGTVEILIRFWPSLWKPTDFIKTMESAQKDASSVEAGAADEARIILENMWLICRILWNSSDASYAMCLRIVESGVVEELVKLLDRQDFDPTHFKKDNVRSYMVKAATGVLHNCLRLYHDATKRKFRESDGVKILEKYLESDVQIIRTKASICLAYGINEEEIDMINAKDDIIKYIITRLLGPSLNNKDHSAVHKTRRIFYWDKIDR